MYNLGQNQNLSGIGSTFSSSIVIMPFLGAVAGGVIGWKFGGKKASADKTARTVLGVSLGGTAGAIARAFQEEGRVSSFITRIAVASVAGSSAGYLLTKKVKSPSIKSLGILGMGFTSSLIAMETQRF